MFVVFKNNRPQGNKKFTSYEAARQWARKLCRRNEHRSLFDTSNPMIGDYGYTIRAV